MIIKSRQLKHLTRVALKKEPKKKSKIEDAPHDLSVAANTSVLVLDKNGKVLKCR